MQKPLTYICNNWPNDEILLLLKLIQDEVVNKNILSCLKIFKVYKKKNNLINLHTCSIFYSVIDLCAARGGYQRIYWIPILITHILFIICTYYSL